MFTKIAPKALYLAAALILIGCSQKNTELKSRNTYYEDNKENLTMQENNTPRIPQSDDEWKAKLDPLSFYVMREKGTERPHTGEYNQHWESGNYYCKGCGSLLFSSTQKFDAGCGWPSFDNTADSNQIELKQDLSHNMIRTEVVCKTCQSHLGHLFDDGPTETGLRYCINSVCLEFDGREQNQSDSSSLHEDR